MYACIPVIESGCSITHISEKNRFHLFLQVGSFCHIQLFLIKIGNDFPQAVRLIKTELLDDRVLPMAALVCILCHIVGERSLVTM
jgi:hypothetical protein